MILNALLNCCSCVHASVHSASNIAALHSWSRCCPCWLIQPIRLAESRKQCCELHNIASWLKKATSASGWASGFGNMSLVLTHPQDKGLNLGISLGPLFHYPCWLLLPLPAKMLLENVVHPEIKSIPWSPRDHLFFGGQNIHPSAQPPKS